MESSVQRRADRRDNQLQDPDSTGDRVVMADTATHDASPGPWWSSSLPRFLLRHILIIVLIVVALTFSVINRNFATLGNFEGIFIQASAFSLLAFGATYVILTAGIDLSVGSIVGLGGVVAVLLLRSHLPLPVAVLGGVAVGGAVGLVNGIVTAYGHVTPFVVTLGTLSIALSASYVLTHGQPVSSINPAFLGISVATAVGIPVPIWIATGLFLLLWLVLARTVYGTHIYSVGGNELASRLCGINVRRVVMSVYIVSGLLAGLAGVLLASRITSGIATTGSGYELDAIAAAVIGGVSLFGGRGRLWGAAIGIIMISMLTDGLDVLNVSTFYQGFVEGGLIIGAVFLDGLYRRIYGDS